jgi:hypothetical protein
MTYNPQTFNDGFTSGSADITYLMNFSPHVLKQVTPGFFFYKCSQRDQTIYTNRKTTNLLADLSQVPHEIYFAL